jgi:hypothetical protein
MFLAIFLALFLFTKLPKPLKCTFSRLAMALVMVCKKASTVSCTSDLLIPVLLAISEMTSDLTTLFGIKVVYKSIPTHNLSFLGDTRPCLSKLGKNMPFLWVRPNRTFVQTQCLHHESTMLLQCASQYTSSMPT